MLLQLTYINTSWMFLFFSVVSSGSYDHTLKVFDARTDKSVMTMEHGQPVESLLLYPSEGLLVSAGSLPKDQLYSHLSVLCNQTYNTACHSISETAKIICENNILKQHILL